MKYFADQFGRSLFLVIHSEIGHITNNTLYFSVQIIFFLFLSLIFVPRVNSYRSFGFDNSLQCLLHLGEYTMHHLLSSIKMKYKKPKKHKYDLTASCRWASNVRLDENV